MPSPPGYKVTSAKTLFFLPLPQLISHHHIRPVVLISGESSPKLLFLCQSEACYQATGWPPPSLSPHTHTHGHYHQNTHAQLHSWQSAKNAIWEHLSHLRYETGHGDATCTNNQSSGGKCLIFKMSKTKTSVGLRHILWRKSAYFYFLKYHRHLLTFWWMKKIMRAFQLATMPPLCNNLIAPTPRWRPSG